MSAEFDLWFYEAGLAELEDYLLSEEIFWPLSGNPPSGSGPPLRLTLGNLILSRTRLLAIELNSFQEAKFSRLSAQYDTLRTHWLSAWGRKCARSFHTRLVQWRNYIEEYRLEPEEQADRYVYEVRWRVILELLRAEIFSMDPLEEDLLTILDAVVQNIIESRDFIWEQELERGFPPDHYWFLYGVLPAQ